VPARLFAISKSGGGERWLTRLDPADARDFRDVVASLVPTIEGALGRSVIANRVVGRGRVRWTTLEPWRPARRAYARVIGGTRRRHTWSLVLDVRDCYGSVTQNSLEGALRDLGCDRAGIRQVLEVMDRFARDGVPGLPVGPEPSAILANALLSVVDRALARAGADCARWVDDIVASAANERGGHRVLDAAVEALASLGLAVHEGKTRIVSADEHSSTRLVSPSGATSLG